MPPRRGTTLTMCRQAATKSAGEVFPLPQEYQSPFISWPKLTITGRPNLADGLGVGRQVAVVPALGRSRPG